MAEHRLRVELTETFLARLDAVGRFLDDADASSAFDVLLEHLRAVVVPNLARFPSIGRRYLEKPPASAESLQQLALMSSAALEGLRVYIHDDYLLLYVVLEDVVHLLSIRHHRELSFDFEGVWPTR